MFRYHTFRISSLTERLLSKLSDYHTIPPSQLLHQPSWLAPHYRELFTAPTLFYVNSVLGHPAFFLDS